MKHIHIQLDDKEYTKAIKKKKSKTWKEVLI